MSPNSLVFISDHIYGDALELFHELITITNKIIALLFKVSSRDDGTIPDAEAATLRRISDRLAVNGNAIDDMRPCKVFGERPTKDVGANFDHETRRSFASDDVRYVARGDTHVIVLGPPPHGVVTLRSLGTLLSRQRKPVLDD